MGVTTRCGRSSIEGRTTRSEPCIFVVFGASGDLTKRKLLLCAFSFETGGSAFGRIRSRRSGAQGSLRDICSRHEERNLQGRGVAETDPRLEFRSSCREQMSRRDPCAPLLRLRILPKADPPVSNEKAQEAASVRQVSGRSENHEVQGSGTRLSFPLCSTGRNVVVTPISTFLVS